LDPFDAGSRLYLGHAFRLEEGGGTWMSGGAGYVMSWNALKSVVINVLENERRKEEFDKILKVKISNC
jgi:hypothetical protein